MKDQAIGAQRDQDHRRHVADPGEREERPGRQSKIEGEDVVGARGPNLVVEREGLHRDHEQEDKGCEHVDRAAVFGTDIGVEKIDGDVGAAIGRRPDTPEDQDAQQQAAEVVAIGDRDTEEIAQQHRNEHVGGDNSDKERGQELDGIDEAIHEVGFHAPAPSRMKPIAVLSRRRRRKFRRRQLDHQRPACSEAPPTDAGQYAALYWASDCLSSFMMAAGSPPALRTLSVHCACSGSADFFHSSSCASVIG